MHTTGRLVEARLVDRRDLGHGYHLCELAAEQPYLARAGQFVMLRSPGWGVAPLLPRPMSVLGAGERLSLLVKVVGEGTRRIASAPLGEPWHVLGPLGRPWARPAEGHAIVLVAGGVGVAPLVMLAEELRAEGRDGITSLYGGRSGADLPLAERLAAAGSLAVATEDGSRGTPGRVTVLVEAQLEALARRGAAAVLYTCGPHAMMAAVAKLAERFGQPCFASLEAPMACGVGVCLGCAVARKGGGYHYTCMDGPPIDAALVDWQARACG